MADSAIFGSITLWRDEFTEKMRKKNEKKKVNIMITLWEFTCTYPQYRGNG
jgi:hypothetical protein